MQLTCSVGNKARPNPPKTLLSWWAVKNPAQVACPYQSALLCSALLLDYQYYQRRSSQVLAGLGCLGPSNASEPAKVSNNAAVIAAFAEGPAANDGLHLRCACAIPVPSDTIPACPACPALLEPCM